MGPPGRTVFDWLFLIIHLPKPTLSDTADYLIQDHFSVDKTRASILTFRAMALNQKPDNITKNGLWEMHNLQHLNFLGLVVLLWSRMLLLLLLVSPRDGEDPHTFQIGNSRLKKDSL